MIDSGAEWLKDYLPGIPDDMRNWCEFIRTLQMSYLKK